MDEELQRMLNSPQIGPASKELLKAMNEATRGIDPSGPAQRLAHLGQTLVEAADRMRAGDELIFDHLTEEDVRSLVNLVSALSVATELAAEARALDAEGN